MSYVAISRHIVCMDMHVDMIGTYWMGADAVQTLSPCLHCVCSLASQEEVLGRRDGKVPDQRSTVPAV